MMKQIQVLNKILILLAVGCLFITSCSKKQIPFSSGNSARTNVSSEMQAFLNDGVEKKLDTGRKKPDQIIKTAEKYIGTPHCMGGTTRKCMDCSGLTYVSFRENKIEIPRRSQDQARYGRIIFDKTDLKKGDLVFFTQSYQTPDFITHVGIYTGNGRFIHASTSGGVIITPLENSWWSQRFVFGTRVFRK
ncbi:MAG: NlpC/P60 family protein [Bacteroidia bacterium]|nr:NlpC/P60 family protein [Bacteroidia bacterium]